MRILNSVNTVLNVISYVKRNLNEEEKNKEGITQKN